MMQTNTQQLVVVQTIQGVSIILHTMPLVTARAGPTISVSAVFFYSHKGSTVLLDHI